MYLSLAKTGVLITAYIVNNPERGIAALTDIKVVEGEVEGDSDYLAVGSSSLRTKNADLAFGSRYVSVDPCDHKGRLYIPMCRIEQVRPV